MRIPVTESDVIRANVDVHTRMAETYDQLEPHFRPENRAKVRRMLEGLRARTGGSKMLDLGCGTGFLLHLARDLFGEIHGVDITAAMLARVDTSSGNIFLHNIAVERLPFPDNHFDLVTAYSFLHHLTDYQLVLREACRVLKPGGLFYADLDPNKLFWDAMTALANVPAVELAPWVLAARESVLSTDAKVEADFGIPQETFRLAEYSKAILGGLDPRAIRNQALAVGFSGCEVKLAWYVGQAQVMHGQSFEEAERVGAYLRAMSPLSDHLFKYIQFVLVK